MADVHYVHDDSAASASMTMMVAVFLIIAIMAVLGFLAYNGNLFRAAVPADQPSNITIEGDVNLPPSNTTTPGSGY